MGPKRLFSENINSIKAVRFFLIKEGISLDILFSQRHKPCIFVSTPYLAGMDPMRLLSPKLNSIRKERFPTYKGMMPQNIFEDKSSILS